MSVQETEETLEVGSSLFNFTLAIEKGDKRRGERSLSDLAIYNRAKIERIHLAAERNVF